MSLLNHWDVESARRLYNIRHWGEGFFDIDMQGRLCATPVLDQAVKVPLQEVVEEARRQGLRLPLLMRFSNILGCRVQAMVDAFSSMMEKHHYTGSYTCVYPIKVNQRSSVVTELIQRGGEQIGLEAGSKPELMVILALAERANCTVICNGYKDREYIQLALLGRAMGLNTYIVIEKAAEFDLVLEESQRLGVEPLLGVRLRLSSIGKGRWQNTGGEKAKFGLSSRQLIDLVHRAKKYEMLKFLRLLHFHMGSQISNGRDLQRGIGEACRFFVEMRRLGAPIDTLDVGGGLAVDYEGIGARSTFSMNYSLEQYAEHIIDTIERTCLIHDIPHPNVITESGRALTAHHAVFVSNVTAVEQSPDWNGEPLPREAHHTLSALHSLAQNREERPPAEAYYEALHYYSEGQQLFVHGLLSLEERAFLDELYHATCRWVYRALDPRNRAHRELLDELADVLADKYFCNFSVFRSVPDVWAIDQVFPIVPLTRLNEPPANRARLEDLTCDSDGRIEFYVEQGGISTTLPVHRPAPDSEYLFGIFMVGAYQETLGDIHNLFGSSDAVHVEVEGQHWSITSMTSGDTAEKILTEVGYNPRQLEQALQHKIQHAALDPEAQELALKTLQAGLTSYTYLSS
ncbi:MAG: biosynthetic arginine decarboxylase [Myxococcota bacterium]